MQDEKKVIRWKWEFMRRNPKYGADYEKLQKLRQEIGYDRLIKQIEKDRFQWEKDHPTNPDNMVEIVANLGKREEWLRTKRKKELEIIKSYEQEEMKYSNKWSSGWFGKMYDPGKSYEEILDSKANKKDIAEWFKNDTSQWAFRKGLGSAAVKEIQYMTLPNGSVGFSNLLYIEPGDYFLKINFKKVNSIGAIKKLVCDMLDSQYSLQKRAKHSTYIKRDDGTIELKPYDKKIHPKEGQKYEIDYDRILKVGILKEEGKTNEEVAKILFPQAFEETEDDIANPESAIRMISNYYKTYQELVTGGYEKISST